MFVRSTSTACRRANAIPNSLQRCTIHTGSCSRQRKALMCMSGSALDAGRLQSLRYEGRHLRQQRGSVASAWSRRNFASAPVLRHNELTPPKPGEERHVTFIDKEGVSHTFAVADGDNLLDIAQSNDLEMEGACGGSCACSTCHVIVSSEDLFDKMEEPTDDENDMLDLAFGLTETSRLGCQVKMSKELDGLEVRLPSMTRNMQASDFKEKEKG